MRLLAVFSRLAAFLCLTLVLFACQKNSAESETPIPYSIPASSSFAKIQPGWTMKKVRGIIGNPTDTRTYTTGMAFYVPLLSGDSDYRAEDFYKGQGRIVYAGSADTGLQSYAVLQIIYNEEESGYADKGAYPDGPQNKLKPGPENLPEEKKRPSKRTAASPAQADSSPALTPAPASAPAPVQPAPSAPAQPAPAPPAASDDPLSGL